MNNYKTLLINKAFIGVLLVSSCNAVSKPDLSETPDIEKDTIVKVEVPIEKTPAIEVKPALGIDVSHFQGEVNWVKIKSHDISFAYAKATQGIHFVDSRFKTNWENMLSAGIARGAYHFYSSANGGEEQANHFINTVGELKTGDLYPVLDLEQGGVKDKVDVNEFQKEVKIWLNLVESHLGVKPIIYTNNPFANEYLNHGDFSEYLLWIAEYGVKEAKTPDAWKDKGWAIWQRTAKGEIEGEVGDVDHDITKGVLEDLLIK